MKGIIKNTGEIIDVTTSKNLSGETVLVEINTALVFSLDEIELMPAQKMVSLDEVCEWLYDKLYTRANGAEHYVASKEKITQTEFVENLRKTFGE